MKEVKRDNQFEEFDQEDAGTEYNPTDSIAETSASSAIALMRIYDVLMCLYAEENPQDARSLAKLHAAGKLRSTLPFLELDD